MLVQVKQFEPTKVHYSNHKIIFELERNDIILKFNEIEYKLDQNGKLTVSFDNNHKIDHTNDELYFKTGEDVYNINMYQLNKYSNISEVITNKYLLKVNAAKKGEKNFEMTSFKGQSMKKVIRKEGANYNLLSTQNEKVNSVYNIEYEDNYEQINTKLLTDELIDNLEHDNKKRIIDHMLKNHNIKGLERLFNEES